MKKVSRKIRSGPAAHALIIINLCLLLYMEMGDSPQAVFFWATTPGLKKHFGGLYFVQIVEICLLHASKNAPYRVKNL